MAKGTSQLVKFVRKYGVSIIFPVLSLSAIYADYSHTQAWKAQKLAIALAAASELQ